MKEERARRNSDSYANTASLHNYPFAFLTKRLTKSLDSNQNVTKHLTKQMLGIIKNARCLFPPRKTSTVSHVCLTTDISTLRIVYAHSVSSVFLANIYDSRKR